MQKAEAHVYFLDTIGMGDWFYGTTLNDVRYCVEGWAAYEGGSLPENELPTKVVLHFPNCKGGDVVEGYGIYNYLRGLAAKGVAIETRVEGLCASIAVLVALAADTVLMAEAALWMVHKPSSCGAGTADELRAEADVLDKIQAQIAGRYVARTGMDLATANDLINKESWLDANECLALGFVTGKLPDAPLQVPTGADAVLNYFPTTKTPQNMALSPAEKKSFFNELKEELKSIFAPKNDAAPAPVAEPTATNVATKVDVTGGDPMYTADAEVGAGSLVYSDEALTTAYPDGDYTLADGREATVLSGAVSEIEAGETNEAPAAPAATNTADEALVAELATLKAENAAKDKLINSLKNKVAKQVPGSAGNPTPAGAANVSAPKNAVAPKAAAHAFNIRKN